MDTKQFDFSFTGRVNRSVYWQWCLPIIIIPIFVLLSAMSALDISLEFIELPDTLRDTLADLDALMEATRRPTLPLPDSFNPVLISILVIFSAIVAILFTWASLAITAKRYHDRDKSAWWILIALIPIIGVIWMLIELGFLKGTDGPNRFGSDPSAKDESTYRIKS